MILSIALCIALIIWLIYLYSQIRFDVNSIVDYKPNLTTQFVDKNNQLIANIFKKQHRFYVKFEDIPPKIIESLIAIEDTQFFEHNGINIDAILRAIIKDIKYMKMVEGASTITQQLVRTLALSRDKKIIRKIKEILLSLRVETLLTKEEILERYLNEVYFGHGYYGIKTASLGYFDKQLNELNIKEIAILVGLPQAPSFYDPTRNLKLSLARANQVVKRLQTLGWINHTQFNEAINFQPDIKNRTLTQNKAPYVIDYAIKQLKNRVKNLRSGGYTIQLTIDLQAQQIAKDALKFGYNRIKKRDRYKDTNKSTTKTLNGAIISIENSTGKIISMVGGVDYKKSSFNRVTQSRRQAGSAIKPFIYQSALNIGYSTVSDLIDISRTYEYEDMSIKDENNQTKKWKPSNYESNYKGIVSLKYALVHSRNLATINLVQEIGIDVIYKNLLYYGFENIPYDMSITLGSFGISALKLSRLYTILSNKGIRVDPYLIQSIKNDNNNIEFGSNETYIQENTQAFLTTTILKEVVQSGTGRQARIKGLEVVGKTGTTNKYKDAWFCGFSPTIQTIVWFGNDDNSPMRRTETGGGASAPVFRYFYKNYLKLHPEIARKFETPQGVNSVNIDGKIEYFTNKSPIVKTQNNQIDKLYYNQVDF
jgi:penicillin-binding protein 1A